MDELVGLIIGLLVLALLVALLVLPIVALTISIRTRRKLTELSRLGVTPPTEPGATPTSLAGVVQQLTTRVAHLEAVLAARPLTPAESAEAESPPAPPRIQPEPIQTPPAPPFEPAPQTPPLAAAPPPAFTPPPPRAIKAAELESIIGRRWLGWAAVALILFATAFFLKYAFDNRWIGELGRVAIGVAAGVTLTVLGFRYHQKRWRIFSQILTGGGVVLLYLSAYASFGYYHLATQKAAFVYMAILIAEAAGLALWYEAPAIGVMALIGGFLSPLLLRSDRDQYRSLFTYIAGLDIGTLALLQHWPGLSSIAFLGTHFLFWLWYADNYHPRKLGAVMIFQTAVFLIFLVSHVSRRFFRKPEVTFEDAKLFLTDPFKFLVTFETCSLLLTNAFGFFATAYYFLNPENHEWMGALAIGMALLYAATAKLLLDRSATTRTELLTMIGVALTFATLAVPIQLKTNWITMAWAVEGLIMLWAGFQIKSRGLTIIAHLLLALALAKLVFWDTPLNYRPMFTPVLNKYFLASLFVTVCLFAAAFIHQKFGNQKQATIRLALLIVAIITLWFVMTVEAQTFFAARAGAKKIAEDARHERWLGQMTLSVLWSIYAAVLMALGFIRRAAAIRWAALSLFALTVIKVMLVDIAVLQQLYRIIAFLVLGLLLLLVAWGYHKAFHSKES